MNGETLRAFVAKLEIPADARESLMKMTPATYIGNAAQQAAAIRKHVKG